jgi:hypothetical protein
VRAGEAVSRRCPATEACPFSAAHPALPEQLLPDCGTLQGDGRPRTQPGSVFSRRSRSLQHDGVEIGLWNRMRQPKLSRTEADIFLARQLLKTYRPFGMDA